VIQSFEPGESWFWDFENNRVTNGAVLAPPHHHPATQPAPGPEGRVPENWQSLLHD